MIRPLLQEGVQLRQYFDCPVKRWIGALLIGADTNQVFRANVGSHQQAKRLSLLHMRFGGDTRHQTAQTLEHGDGRVVTPHGQVSVKNHMPVEQRPHRIGDRVLLIVAFHQNRVKGSNAADS